MWYENKWQLPGGTRELCNNLLRIIAKLSPGIYIAAAIPISVCNIW